MVMMKDWMRDKPGKGGILQLDKSYNFIEKDQIIYTIRDLIGDDGRSRTAVANRAGINPSTLQKWFDGKTKRPQLPNVIAVLHALGKKLTIT